MLKHCTPVWQPQSVAFLMWACLPSAKRCVQAQAHVNSGLGSVVSDEQQGPAGGVEASWAAELEWVSLVEQHVQLLNLS